MIFSKLDEFCDATAVPLTTSADEIIGNVIDTAAAPTLKNLGTTPVYLVVNFDTSYVAPTTTTLTLSLVSDSTANLATSKTTHLTLPALTSATGVIGYQYVAALPANWTYERYLGMWAVNGVPSATAGKINAFLTLDPPSQPAAFLPDGIA